MAICLQCPYQPGNFCARSGMEKENGGSRFCFTKGETYGMMYEAKEKGADPFEQSCLNFQ